MPLPIRRRSFVSLLLSASAAGVAKTCGAAPTNRANELIPCGRERVYILDLDARDPSDQPKILWTWQAAGRSDLPKEFHPLFRSTDECKPVEGGRRILITSSTGGVALVERDTGAVVFYGRAANAHSADLLPNNRIAVAASRDPRNHQGDSLILFDVAQSGRELWRTPLPSGHGVVWDEQRQRVWALADAEIHAYEQHDWKSAQPTLKLVATIPLGETGGHELFPVPGTPALAVTTSEHCWLFDRDKKSLQPHPSLGDESSIKCLSVHPITRQIAYIKADRPNWWSETIRFLGPDDSVRLNKEQFYKVRWNVAPL